MRCGFGVAVALKREFAVALNCSLEKSEVTAHMGCECLVLGVCTSSVFESGSCSGMCGVFRYELVDK